MTGFPEVSSLSLLSVCADKTFLISKELNVMKTTLSNRFPSVTK